MINAAIKKALDVPRSEALKRVEREKSDDRVVFVVTYDPRLPSLSKIIGKHWRTMALKWRKIYRPDMRMESCQY